MTCSARIVCYKVCLCNLDFQTFTYSGGWLKLHTPLHAVTPLVGNTGKQKCKLIPVVVTSVFIPLWVRADCSEGCFLCTCDSK